MKKVPEKQGSEYYRRLLSPQGKAFYDRIYAQLLRGNYSGETSFLINKRETATSDCFAAYKAIRDDHPEFFFLGFQSEFTCCGQMGTLKYPILYSADIIARIQQQMRKSIYRIVRGTAHLQVIDREALVYERIARKLSYNNHSDVRDHNIVGPILMSSGVCEGHNALLLLCFRRIGIPCIKVYGKTKTDGWHCWTIAWINGTPVHCDVTWDSSEDGIMRFDYFNLSDEQISCDHYEFKSAIVPECKSENWNYYRYNGLSVNSFKSLRSRIKSDSLAATLPILIHFNYCPPAGDYLKEVKKAFSAEQIYGKHTPLERHLAMAPETTGR